ncbi:MAG TPA: DUF3105 domain-containing protein [Polyangiales bacterium]|jgi:hypothetical protein
MRVLFIACVLAGCSGSSAQKQPRDGAISGSSDAAIDGSSDAGLCTSCGGCEETLLITTAVHQSGDIQYDDPPPAGGPHNNCWGEWGVQATELRPERWVHNLEHGGIVFLYRCEEPCDDDVQTLTDLTNAHPRTILTSYADLPTRFAVVSWGHRIKSDCVDRAVFEAFYERHFDHGLEEISDGPPADCAEFPDL